MSPDLTVRPATNADARDLWRWRNDDRTRAMSRDDGEVPWADHLRWFERALTDPLRTILIGELGADAVGMCRFDADPTHGDAEVSIVIAPAMRGRGLARRLLASAIASYRATHPAPLRATIRNDNPASIACFERNGFNRTDAGPRFSTYELPRHDRQRAST